MPQLADLLRRSPSAATDPASAALPRAAGALLAVGHCSGAGLLHGVLVALAIAHAPPGPADRRFLGRVAAPRGGGVRHLEVRAGHVPGLGAAHADQRRAGRPAGVDRALVAMATELNLDLLAGMGFPPPGAAGPNDMLVAVVDRGRGRARRRAGPAGARSSRGARPARGRTGVH